MEEVKQIGPVANRAGRAYLTPPHFLPKQDKQTPILRLVLGYNNSDKWHIPTYLPELASVCSRERYETFSAELARVMRDGEAMLCWDYCSYYCCLCTLGLSCLPKMTFTSTVKGQLQEVCDRFNQEWKLPPGTLSAVSCASNSPITVTEVGLESIPVDEKGEPMLDNIGLKNVISPELLRAGICLRHARLYGTVAQVNGVPVYVSRNAHLAIAPGEHLQARREIEIINMLDQDFVAWPPLGFSINVRLTNPLLFQLWPRRVDIQSIESRIDAVHAVQDRAAAAAHGTQNQVAGMIMSAFNRH